MKFIKNIKNNKNNMPGKKLIKLIPLCAALYMLFISCVFYTPFAFALENNNYNYIFDEANLISDENRGELERIAGRIAAEYDFGAYIIITPDYLTYGWNDVEDCAANLYHERNFGVGADRNGLLLLLSIGDRDYALYAYGYGNTAFTDSGKYSLADDYFLDDFRENNFYQGFADYLNGVENYLKQANTGMAVDDYQDGYVDESGYHEYPPQPLTIWNILTFTGLPCLISGLICMGMKSRMKTVRKAASAGNYIPSGGFRLRVRDDRFTHTTESRVKIQKEENHSGGHSGGGGGGTTIRSDGGSSSSGKF